MIGRQQHFELCRENRDDLQTFYVAGQGNDADLQISFLNFFHDFVAEVSVDVHLHLGIEPPKARQGIGQNVEAGGIIGPNAQAAAGVLLDLADSFQGLGAEGQHFFGVAAKRSAGLGEPYGFEITVEKLSPEFPLQPLNLLAQRGLSAIEDGSSAREVPHLGYLEEALEVVKVHSMPKPDGHLFDHVFSLARVQRAYTPICEEGIKNG